MPLQTRRLADYGQAVDSRVQGSSAEGTTTRSRRSLTSVRAIEVPLRPSGRAGSGCAALDCFAASARRTGAHGAIDARQNRKTPALGALPIDDRTAYIAGDMLNTCNPTARDKVAHSLGAGHARSSQMTRSIMNDKQTVPAKGCHS